MGTHRSHTNTYEYTRVTYESFASTYKQHTGNTNTSPPCSHVYKILEIRVSQNPAKLGGVHKMSGMEGGGHWGKLCGLGG